MIDMESMPVIFYISYLYDDALSEKENIYNAHIGAAEINQYFALNAASIGMFARPMRNFEDLVVEQTFGVTNPKERFMYSVIFGMRNTLNYTKYLS